MWHAPSAEDPVGDHVLAVHAEPEARDGDADLRGRDVSILSAGSLQDALDESSERLFPRRARVDCGPRRTDDREFCGNEDGVEQDQHGNDEQRGHHVYVLDLRRRRHNERGDLFRFPLPRFRPRGRESKSSSPGSGSLPASCTTNSPTVPAVLRPGPVDPHPRAIQGKRPWQPHAAVGEPQWGADADPLSSSATLPISSPSYVFERDEPRDPAGHDRPRLPDDSGARAGTRGGDRPASCRALEESAVRAWRAIRPNP